MTHALKLLSFVRCGESALVARAAVIAALAVAALGLEAASAGAQIEVAGEWDQPGGGIFGFQEEFLDRGGGPDLGDYVGLPINDALRYKASLYSPSWLTVPERQCLPHPSTYAYRSPGGLSIVKEFDAVTQRLVAYHVYGSYGLARTIWMDGRAHPAANERHTYEGFSSGRWDGDELIVETSHLKAAFIRRNGVAHSDRARMIEHFIRHDDYLTIVTAVDDPVYLDESFVRSTDYALNAQPSAELAQFGGFVNGGNVQGYGSSDVFYKCSPTDEVALEPGSVPSFMPGANKDLDMFAKRHNVPLEAALGGSATMYPEYEQRLHELERGGTVRPAAASNRAAPRAAEADAPPARVLHVAGQVWMVHTERNNVAVQVGSEGVLVVNPGPAALAKEVLAEIRKLAGDKRIDVLVNTNDAVEHGGANAEIGAGATPRGQRAAVIAHEKTSLRMAQAGLPGPDLPTDTFFRGTRELYFNDEPIEIIHVPGATTDGDVLVFFRKSDVVVAGDVIQDLTYPVVRLDAGGTLDGTIAALNRILGLTVASWRAEGGTLVIPNRGRIYDEGDVAEYRDVVTISRDRIRDALRKGQSLADIKAARILRDYDGRYGADKGPASADAFLDTAYRSLSGDANSRSPPR
jgi:glyoxylase-like metal-dependent hydrolase (beta-lactamase superfamily II)